MSFFFVFRVSFGGSGFEFFRVFWVLGIFGFLWVSVFFGFQLHTRVKNKTRIQTRFYVGRVQVWVTGAKMDPNPHPSGAKPAGYLKPELELSSLGFTNKRLFMVKTG
jgi:hypothetical protein